MIAVLDYGIGNLRSAQKALEKVGADALLTLPGAKHYLGGIKGYSLAETDDEDPERLAITQRMLGDGADTLGVAAAVSFPAAVALLGAVILGATGYAGYRLRALRLTGSES